MTFDISTTLENFNFTLWPIIPRRICSYINLDIERIKKNTFLSKCNKYTYGKYFIITNRNSLELKFCQLSIFVKKIKPIKTYNILYNDIKIYSKNTEKIFNKNIIFNNNELIKNSKKISINFNNYLYIHKITLSLSFTNFNDKQFNIKLSRKETTPDYLFDRYSSYNFGPIINNSILEFYGPLKISKYLSFDRNIINYQINNLQISGVFCK